MKDSTNKLATYTAIVLIPFYSVSCSSTPTGPLKEWMIKGNGNLDGTGLGAEIRKSYYEPKENK